MECTDATPQTVVARVEGDVPEQTLVPLAGLDKVREALRLISEARPCASATPAAWRLYDAEALLSEFLAANGGE